MVEVAQAQGVTCPICGWSGESFEPMGRKQRPNAQCPNCKSLERHRALFLYVRDESTLFTRPARVLHFAPEPSLRRVFEDRENLEYVSTDLEMPDVSMRMDIHDLVFRDGTFDFVICSHVLEHVDDDRAAMREIRRVLRPEGTALIMVPILSPGGRTFEDATITTPEGRELAFGQVDHVRRYGSDFPERAREAGIEVEAFRPFERWGSAAEQYALYPDEVLFVGGPAPAAEQSAADKVAAAEAPDQDPSPPHDAGEEVEIWFDTRISPQDSMARPDRLDHYFLIGIEALRLVEDALATVGRPDPATILDLPCGYGRVLRMLRAAFPKAAITACDLDRGGVEFCERTFGVEGAFSERQLDELSLARTYELVWCGSLLTHLPEEDARAALRGLVRHLAPEGLLVFTTHGDAIHRLLAEHVVSGSVDDPARPELLRAYERLEEPARSKLLRAFDEEGFGFAPYPDSHDASYGFALSSTDWVEARLAELPGVIHVESWARAWHGRQDVYVCHGARD